MKRFIGFVSVFGLVVPAAAFAAYNDVSLQSGAKFSVNGVTLSATGGTSEVESVTVNSGSFTVTLQPHSALTVQTTAGASLTTDAPNFNIVSNTCSSGDGATLVLEATQAALITTITPSTSACTSGGSSSTGSGSGSGGGGSIAVTVAASPAPATPESPSSASDQRAALIAQLNAQVQALLAQIAAVTGSSASSFSRDLQVGMTGADVKALQAYLNTHGFIIVKSGSGSPGNETSRFGALTKAALIALQKAAGISPASGFFGPKTRAYIAAHP